MIKLKTILKEGYAWERKSGEPLPTLEQTTAAYAAKLAESNHGDIFDEIADEMGLSSAEFDAAINKTGAELDVIEKIYHSNGLTRTEALSQIADMLDVTIGEDDYDNDFSDPMIDEADAKPDYIDLDNDGDEEESMRDAAKDKESMQESFARRLRSNLHGSEFILSETFKRK